MSTTTQATDTVLSVSNLTVCFAGAPANVVDGVSF
jgi:peptide/nickel transport system ATP-binding protein